FEYGYFPSPHIAHTKPEVGFQAKVKLNGEVSHEREKEVYSPSSPTSSKTCSMTSIICLVETWPSGARQFSLTVVYWSPSTDLTSLITSGRFSSSPEPSISAISSMSS